MPFRRALVAASILATAIALAGPARPAAALPAQICFPHTGITNFVDTFGAPRVGHTHQGLDLFTHKGTPIIATVDGTVYRYKTDTDGTAGRALGIQGVDGWRYLYLHLDNDNPGTDDGAAPVSAAFAPGIQLGATVLAGQVIGWSGDSGNAETTLPHVHFEIRQPDNTPINPYTILRAANRQCGHQRVVSVATHRGGGFWVLTSTGHVAAFGGAPFLGEPNYGFDIARSIAAMPDGNGYVVLDGFGGLTRYGSAGRLPTGGPYWPGWDIANDIDVSPDGTSYVILDGWGGVHAVGALSQVGNRDGSYWRGWDIARDVEVMPDGRGWIVLDGWGGLHPSGSAVPLAPAYGFPYWPGWDVARDLEVSGTGTSVYLLDALGGLHRRGPAGSNIQMARAPSPYIAMDVVGTGFAVARTDGLTVGM
jgi:hypothetical protein